MGLFETLVHCSNLALFLCEILAVVNKLIKEIVPNIRVSTDARDLLLNCCTGAYLLILFQACGQESKKSDN